MSYFMQIEDVQITRRPSRAIFPVPIAARRRRTDREADIARAAVREVLG